MTPPPPVARALAALRREDWAGALVEIVQALEQVEDPALRARLHGWHAQALHRTGSQAEARAAVRRALGAAREHGDTDAEQPLRALHGRISAALAAEQALRARTREAQRLASQPLEDLLAVAEGAGGRAEVLLQRADALFETGRPEEATAIAHRGLAEAPASATREQVLLRLCLLRARSPSAEKILQEALALAEEAEDHTMRSAGARAAGALGLPLPEHTF